MTVKFFDTCSLLLAANNFDILYNKFAISSVTYTELEAIKTSPHKDSDVKYAARKIVNFLNDHPDAYDMVIYNEKMDKPLKKIDITINDDAKILACAVYYQKNHSIEDVVFVTNDLILKNLASFFFERVDSIQEEEDTYTGFKDLYIEDFDLAHIYEHPYENPCELLTNEYLIIRNNCDEVVDILKWNGSEMIHISYKEFDSRHFGKVKPFKDDPYQACAADSLFNNKVTMIKGPAGSGKTILSLAFLLHQLERGRIDKIIIFCNTVATKDSAKLGYYPGDRNEKLLDSQIGNLLASKFGGMIEVERMVNDETLILLPMSDIRGYDTTGMRAGVYISEAQNMSVNLMKLALQRIGEDSICIIDGDCRTQVDDVQYAGSNNGMRRASQIFRGHDIYGEVTLQQIHRSKIGQIAESM